METRSRVKSLNADNRKEINNNSDEDESVEEEKQRLDKRTRYSSFDDTYKVSGKEVYGFKTPKRKGQMAEKAGKSSSKKVNVEDSKLEDENDSPKNGLRKLKRNGSEKRRSSSEAKAQGGTPPCVGSCNTIDTPYSLRRRIKKQLVRMTDLSNDDGVSEESGISSDEEEEEEDGEEMKQTPKGKKKKTTSSLQTKAENYFVAHEQRSKTSDNTLARLEAAHFDLESLNEILDNVPRSHRTQCQRLESSYRQYFNKWIFQLSNGFNLLLHGLGSKLELLSDFREVLTREHTVVVVNGFFPSVSIKQILNSITDDVFDHKGDFTRLEEQVEFISNSLAESKAGKLYLIINNIDGTMLRNERAQCILCSLAEIEQLQLVASIDHINAPLLWDQAKMSAFNWIWYDVTTFAPYVRETSYEDSLLVKQSGSLAISSLTHVFQSLTPNAQGIFLLLAHYQLEHHDRSNYIGMAFQDCYIKCREEFLVNSQLTLKAQLTEFKDHKLIRVKKGADGVEHLNILLESATINEFVAQQKTK